MRAKSTIAMLLIATFAGSAYAGSRCEPLSVKLTPDTRTPDAKLVEKADAGQKVPPSNISYVLADPEWRLVWATPTNAERGVYFFRKDKAGEHRLIGTWGGILEPDERKSAIAFAHDLKGGGPPSGLAGCFADALLDGK